jgi:hypothetical protein
MKAREFIDNFWKSICWIISSILLTIDFEIHSIVLWLATICIIAFEAEIYNLKNDKKG